MDLKTIRRKTIAMRMDGVSGLTTRPDGVAMDKAYVVVCRIDDVPHKEGGFISAEWYAPGTAMRNEVGALENVRFIVDDTVDAPMFLRSADEYKLYPSTQTSK